MRASPRPRRLLPDGNAVGAQAVSAQEGHKFHQEAFLPTGAVRIHRRNPYVLWPGKQRLVQDAGHKELLCNCRKELLVRNSVDRLLFLPSGIVQIRGRHLHVLRTEDSALSSVPTTRS